MAGPHDSDHAHGTGLTLRAEAEETAHSTPAKDERIVKASRAGSRFWLAMAALVPGLAALAIGFIYFSSLHGTLAAETIGAGLALLIVSSLLLSGVWGPAKSAEPGSADTPITAPAQPAASSPPAAPAFPEALPQTAPTIPSPESPAEALALPGTAYPSEPDTPNAGKREANAAAALDAETSPGAAAPGAAPAAELAPTSEAPKRPARQKTQNGHAAPATRAPRTRAKRAPKDGAAAPLPSITRLSQHFPLPAGSKQIDTQAEDLGSLLGMVAEQTVTAVITEGQPGAEHRARLAEKIDAFRQDMAVDPDYAPVVAFLESLVALLRAARPIPPVKTLVDPFDGLYEGVVSLIRSKTENSL
jgi:hypothetical protein